MLKIKFSSFRIVKEISIKGKIWKSSFSTRQVKKMSGIKKRLWITSSVNVQHLRNISAVKKIIKNHLFARVFCKIEKNVYKLLSLKDDRRLWMNFLFYVTELTNNKLKGSNYVVSLWSGNVIDVRFKKGAWLFAYRGVKVFWLEKCQ